MTALHCKDCDDYDCAGFTDRAVTREPLPPLRPERVASEKVRRAAIDAAQKAIDEARRNLTGRGEQ